MKEEALKSGVAVAFSDNITVIENSLESIKSQVAAISKGIMSEEARYKARFFQWLLRLTKLQLNLQIMK